MTRKVAMAGPHQCQRECEFHSIFFKNSCDGTDNFRDHNQIMSMTSKPPLLPREFIFSPHLVSFFLLFFLNSSSSTHFPPTPTTPISSSPAWAWAGDGCGNGSGHDECGRHSTPGPTSPDASSWTPSISSVPWWAGHASTATFLHATPLSPAWWPWSTPYGWCVGWNGCIVAFILVKLDCAWKRLYGDSDCK